MGRTRVGLSGWSYDEWRGDFYPHDLAQKDELRYCGEQFSTLEINGTFYSLSSPDSFRRWYEAVPSDFVFSVKGSRYITHTLRLKGVEGALANFMASGVLDLDEKLGPILWQLPPNLRFDRPLLEEFLKLLPRDTGDARRLAHKHNDKVESPSYGPRSNHRIRHVLEVRSDTFLTDELATVAGAHGVALAFSHARDWPYLEEVTAGFVYLRLHGPNEPYASPYGQDLSQWAERIRDWNRASQPSDPVTISDRNPPMRKSRDVYIYFDNDVGGHAPRDALRLQELLGEN